jgi:hypothetical protein
VDGAQIFVWAVDSRPQGPIRTPAAGAPSTSILLAEARGGINAEALEPAYTATGAGLLAAVLALLGLLLARLLSARTAGVVRAELATAEADRQRDHEHLAEAIRKALDARG